VNITSAPGNLQIDASVLTSGFLFGGVERRIRMTKRKNNS
jgi:hypothetical protein